MSAPSIDLAKKIRLRVLNMLHAGQSSHIGSCYSVIDILSVLYSGVMRYDPKNPHWENRDRFILSKGHAAAAVYAVLAQQGFIAENLLNSYGKNGTPLQGHLSHRVLGVEVSTGSLGHGLPIACGMALAGKRDNKNYHVYIVMSDGECDEGSVWEAALFAAQHQLTNLTAIIDYNKLQGFGRVQDVLDLEPFSDKWRSFRWKVEECDGHDHSALLKVVRSVSTSSSCPNIVIAHTVKGKGVSFMEDKLAWHYRSPDETLLTAALKELE